MIRAIILIILIIAALSYFGISIRALVESDIFQENFSYVWGWCKYVWDKYLAGPADYLWNDVFIDLIWNSFIENMQRIKEGRPTELEEMAPQADFR